MPDTANFSGRHNPDSDDRNEMNDQYAFEGRQIGPQGIMDQTGYPGPEGGPDSGGSLYGTENEWHHDPEKIKAMAQTNDWGFYGCYEKGELIAIESMYINRGQRSIQWVWGAVHPDHLGKGVWIHIGEYNDELVEKSGALFGRVWVVSTHNKSQMTAEQAGYKPMGIDFQWLGGPDGKWYYQPVLWYGKLYGVAREHVYPFDHMILTENTKQFKELTKNLTMHIAALNPLYLTKEDVDAEVINREKEIYLTQAKNSGKPEKIWDKIANGKLQKFYSEVCLMEQTYVKDDKLTVKNVITEAIAKIGENISIKRFVRYQLGEELTQ